MAEEDRDAPQIEAVRKIEGTKPASEKKKHEGEKEGEAPLGGSGAKPKEKD